MRNDGTLAGLAADDVVEVPARVTATARSRCRRRRSRPELLGLVQHVAAYERLALTAARTRDPVDVQEGAARASADRPVRDRRAAARAAGRRGARMILAVDGGNSKTDVALIAEDGALLAHARGPLSSPHHLGLDGLRRHAPGPRRPGRARRPAPASRRSCSPGSTFRRRRTALRAAFEARGWAGQDARRERHVRRPARRHRARLGHRRHLRRRHELRRRLARRAGTSASPRSATSPATGAAATTSAWRRSAPPLGARTAAARATVLEQLVPAHFEPRHAARARALDPRGAAPGGAAVELAPIVMAAAADDAVAARDRRAPGRRDRRLRPGSGRPARPRRRREVVRRRRADAGGGRRCPRADRGGRCRPGLTVRADERAADRRRGAARSRRPRSRAGGPGSGSARSWSTPSSGSRKLEAR